MNNPGFTTGRRANLLGSLWMIAAMAAFAVEDAFIKVAAQSVPAGEVLVIFGLGGALAFALIARVTGDRILSADIVSVPMRIRVAFEIVGRLFYFLAISLTPLSTATVILQATPIVVVGGAALIFGEHVGWRRWLAILIGLTGVLIIIQPGTEGFSLLSILAVIGMLGFAGRDLASRAAPTSIGTSVLGLYGFLAVVVAGVLFSVWEGERYEVPGHEPSLCLLGAVVAGVFAYSCLMKAMRTGEVSAVTPFRYTRLLFGIALGHFLFGEALASSVLVGSALVILAGLFILWRGRCADPPGDTRRPPADGSVPRDPVAQP